jgi:hypothetical protein
MNSCLVRVATSIGLVGVFAVAFALMMARNGGMLATCVL